MICAACHGILYYIRIIIEKSGSNFRIKRDASKNERHTHTITKIETNSHKSFNTRAQVNVGDDGTVHDGIISISCCTHYFPSHLLGLTINYDDGQGQICVHIV